jgi:outer membrane protein assembly factor BamC
MTHRTLPGIAPRILALAAAATLAGCAALDNTFGGARVDYRSEAKKTPALEVPPDLTQLARSGRYRPQGGVVTASGVAAGAAGSSSATAQTVALSSLDNMRIERDGSFRWLVVSMAPEQLWPQLQSFWRENGFELVVDNPGAGVMETGWAENRTRIPQDVIRRTLGRLVENLYDSGVRDSFRTRVERSANGTEIFILHRSVTEEFAGQQRERTVWRNGPNDPQLEAEFLSRLMVKLGQQEATARQAVAAVPAGPSTPAPVVAEATSLELNEPFDRAYRRVGMALDRAGFTVEDRDRSAGLFFVRYVATGSGDSDQGLLSRIFGSKDPQAPARYRVLVKSAGESRSSVSVQNSQGQPETGDVAKRIIGRLSSEVR